MHAQHANTQHAARQRCPHRHPAFVQPGRPPIARTSGDTCQHSSQPLWLAVAPWPPGSSTRRARHIRAHAASLAAGVAALAASINPSVVATAVAASLKLLFVCTLVAWLSWRGALPPATASVLSQVAFNLTIPCMLLVSTVRVLAEGPHPSLACIPLAAIVHTAAGALLGRAAAAAVTGQSRVARALLGWGDLHPGAPASAIAAGTAAAMGVPQAAAALLPPREVVVPPALPALVQLACTFGNCMTLPLIYAASLLPADPAARAAAYVALYHAAWSPLLWTAGLALLRRDPEEARAAAAAAEARRRLRARQAFLSGLPAWWQRVARAGGGASTTEVLMPRQQQQQGAPPGRKAAGGAGSVPAAPGPPQQRQPPPQQQQPQPQPPPQQQQQQQQQAGGSVVEAELVDPGETPAEALLRRLAALGGRLLGGGRVLAAAREALNPPLVAVLAAVAIGLSPLGQLLTQPLVVAAWPAASPGLAATPVPWELGLIKGGLGAVWEVLEMLATASLAIQSLVLGASLFGGVPLGGGQAAAAARGGGASGGGGREPAQAPPPGAVEVLGGDGESTVVGGAVRAAGAPAIVLQAPSAADADGASASVLAQLLPRGEWEWRAVAAVGAARFVAMPLVGWGLVAALGAAGLLPPDPVAVLVLLLQSAMPPAQNLVLLMRLRGGSEAGAPMAARLLLQLYVLAVLPVTAWIAVFVSVAGL